MKTLLRGRFLMPVALVLAAGLVAIQGVRADDENGDEEEPLASLPLTYQGRIFADGEPIPSGEYEITLDLFSDANAGNRLCGEPRETASVIGGFFTQAIGDPACQRALRLPRSAVYVRVLARGGIFGDRDVEVGIHPISTGLFAKHAEYGGGSIGDIVASMLTEDQFQALRGAGWVLADGSEHPNSLYAEITGEDAVPDLRGVFLRGKDHGRDEVDGTGNPEGDLELGTYQADELRRHHHSVHPLAGVDDGEDVGPEVSATDESVRAGRTSAYGGDETRPRNVTVNYFIRVN